MPLSQDSVKVSAFAISPEKAGSPLSYYLVTKSGVWNCFKNSQVLLFKYQVSNYQNFEFSLHKGQLMCLLPAAKNGRKHLFSTKTQSTAEKWRRT